MPFFVDMCYGLEDDIEFVSLAAEEDIEIEGVHVCGNAAETFSESLLYVGTSQIVDEIIETWNGQSVLNLIASDCDSDTKYAARAHLNLATSPLSFAEIFNRIIENWDLSNSLKNQLENIPVGYDSLERFLSTANTLLKSRATIYALNSSFSVMGAHATSTGRSGQSCRVINEVNGANFFSEHLGSGTSVNVQIVPLQAGRFVLGYLIIEANSARQMPRGFVALLARCAELHIDESKELVSIEGNEVESLLSDIFSSMPKDENAILERLRNLPYKIGKFVRFMLVSSDNGSVVARPNFVKGLQKIFPGCNMASYDKFIVVLIPEEADFLHHYKFDEQMLNALLEKNEARAVFSRVAQSVLGMRTVYLQSRDIYDLALPERYTKGNRFTYFGDVSDFYRAFLCASAMADYNGHNLLRFLTHPIVSRVLKHDEANNSNLFEVLINYLENDCSVSKVADAMCYHRNTIINKVNQIRELFKIDFSDCKLKMDLYASCQIARYAMHVNQMRNSEDAFLSYDN